MTMALRHATSAPIVTAPRSGPIFLKGYCQGRICENILKKGKKTKNSACGVIDL
jgi:hypothetical protein